MISSGSFHTYQILRWTCIDRCQKAKDICVKDKKQIYIKHHMLSRPGDSHTVIDHNGK